MRPYNQISVIVGLVLLVSLLSFLIRLPERIIDVKLFGDSWQVVFSGPWFLGLALTIAIYLGHNTLLRTHPASCHAGLGYTLTFWPLPGLLTFLALPFLHTFSNPLLWGGGTLLLALLLAAILLAQYNSITIGSPLYRVARWFLNLLAFALAFALFFYLCQLDAPLVASVLTLFFVSGALSLEILRQGRNSASQTWLYALLVALVIGEMAWVLSYWSLDSLLAGLYLFWPFYLLTSVIHQHLGGRITRAAAIEFVALALVGYGVLVYYTP